MEIKSDQNMEQDILGVAERLFLEKGFVRTSTTEIAKEVGCNQALVHYYFRTKENLFNTIFELKFKMFFKGLFEMKNMGELSFQDKLKFIIESHFEILRKNPKIPSLIINELSRQPEEIDILREKLYRLPEQLFAELNEELQVEIIKGNIRNISIMDLVFSIFSLNMSMFIMMPILEKLLPLNETQKELMIQHRKSENVDFVLKSLRP
jgi:AcrR family transcriptional regulator